MTLVGTYDYEFHIFPSDICFSEICWIYSILSYDLIVNEVRYIYIYIYLVLIYKDSCAKLKNKAIRQIIEYSKTRNPII